jgi:hypothetical protein
MKIHIITSIILVLIVVWLSLGIFINLKIIAIPLFIIGFGLLGVIIYLCILGIVYTFKKW